MNQIHISLEELQSHYSVRLMEVGYPIKRIHRLAALLVRLPQSVAERGLVDRALALLEQSRLNDLNSAQPGFSTSPHTGYVAKTPPATFPVTCPVRY